MSTKGEKRCGCPKKYITGKTIKKSEKKKLFLDDRKMKLIEVLTILGVRESGCYMSLQSADLACYKLKKIKTKSLRIATA